MSKTILFLNELVSVNVIIVQFLQIFKLLRTIYRIAVSLITPDTQDKCLYTKKYTAQISLKIHMEIYVLMINNKEYKTLCKFNVRHRVKKTQYKVITSK